MAKGVVSEVDAFPAVCAHAGIGWPMKEYRFLRPRRFRFDYAWPQFGMALEVEGGAFVSGRHTRGAGFRNDLEKYNLATVRGWRVIRVLPEQLFTPSTMDMLRELRSSGRPIE